MGRRSIPRATSEPRPATRDCPEGGLIKAAWIDGHRLIAASRGPTLTVVGVDPAESGEGDQTGIVGGQVGRDGQIALANNVSAHLTSEGWVNRVVELAVAIGASRIVVEGYSAATTYVRLLREAVDNQGVGQQITVSTWPPKGTPRRGDALSLSQGLTAALETGWCRIAGQLDGLEADMLSWEAGQHQPDSVAAATIVFETLAASSAARVTLSVPSGRLGQRGGAPGLPRGHGRPSAAVQPVGTSHRALTSESRQDLAITLRVVSPPAQGKAWKNRRKIAKMPL